jgi:hypothetical protein
MGHCPAGRGGLGSGRPKIGVAIVSIDVLKRAKLLFGKSEPEARPVAPKKPVNPFHAVTIAPGPRACAAALDLQGQRFLSREAPALPLRKCESGSCTCRYEHYDDRRHGPRRAREMGVSIDGYDGEDHRDKPTRGRRKADT